SINPASSSATAPLQRSTWPTSVKILLSLRTTPPPNVPNVSQKKCWRTYPRKLSHPNITTGLTRISKNIPAALANGGARNSAAAWVHSTLVGPFLDEFFPRLDADDWSRFLPFIAASINNRFNNHSHKINIADPTQRRGLTNPEFLWEWDNKNVVETSWRAEVKKDP
ncbi:hypothetical protein FRC10_007605, partial [Ceratobasidium sp. 414]